MRIVFFSLTLVLAASAQSARSGLDVGARIPPFALQDQSGKTQTFDTVKGEKGAVLVFFRSADW